MKIKKKIKKIYKILLFVLIFICFIYFLLFVLNKNVNLFYTPTQVYFDNIPIEKKIKIGGFVKKGSVVNDNSLNVFFEVTDYQNCVSVKYNGLLPDLFGENKGVVVVGYLDKNIVFIAEQVLAKHDENYVSKENLNFSKLYNK